MKVWKTKDLWSQASNLEFQFFAPTSSALRVAHEATVTKAFQQCGTSCFSNFLFIPSCIFWLKSILILQKSMQAFLWWVQFRSSFWNRISLNLENWRFPLSHFIPCLCARLKTFFEYSFVRILRNFKEFNFLWFRCQVTNNESVCFDNQKNEGPKKWTKR